MFVIPLKVQINSYHDRVGESSADDGFLTALRTHIHESKPRWNGACSGIQVPPSSTMTTAEGADIASKRLLSDLKRLNMLRRYCLLPSEQTHSPGGGNQHYALLISGELHPSVPKRTGFASCFTTANNRENCEGYSDPLWGYKMMKEYHASLTEAEKRGFPVTDEGRFSETGMDGGGKQIGLEVSWKSAFDTSRTVRRSNIRYERACVLFNIAALESYIGAKSDRSTVAGTDEAIKRFQNAAGIFKHLTLLEVDPSNMKPDPENNYKPDIDLNKDCLTMLEYLMLAQAQACMFEKVCKHQPVAANATTSRLKVWWHCLSKIAMGASVLYEKAFSHSNSEFFALYIDSRWSYSMKAWLAAFKAISQYWQSFIDEERAKAAKGAGYGNCLGRLQLSMDFMNNDVLPNSRKAGMDVATFEDYIRNISERLLEVEYDNSTCIREKTVEPYALNKIPHTTITIPRDFDQHFFAESLSKRLFVGMLSIRAMEKYTEFSILSSNLYEKVRKEIDKIESRIIKACHSKNIENNLEIFNETGGISVSLWGKVTATRKQKEVREVLDTYVQFQVTSADVKIKIGDLDNHFRNVINEHETYRNNNSATHLTNAKEKGEALSVELSNTKGKLDEASKIDAMINSNIKYQDLQEKSRTIMMDKSELDLKFPSMTQEESERCNFKKMLRLFDCIEYFSNTLGKQIRKDFEMLRDQADLINKLAEIDKLTLGSSDTNYDAHIKRALENIEKNIIDKVNWANNTLDRIIPEYLVLYQDYNEVFSASKSVKESQSNVKYLKSTICDISKQAKDFSRNIRFYKQFTKEIEEIKAKVEIFEIELLQEREDHRERSSSPTQNDVFSVDDQLLAQLSFMGFDMEKSKEALTEQNNNLEAALEYLMTCS